MATVVLAPPAPVHVGDLRVERWSDGLVRVEVSFVVPRSTVATEPTASDWLFLAGTAAVLAVVVLGSSVHRSRRRTRSGRDAGERGMDVREA